MKTIHKSLLWSASVVLASMPLAMLACGGGTGPANSVALVTDAGTIEDKSFNQQAWEALKEIDSRVNKNNYIEPKGHDAASLSNAYRTHVTNGKSIIVAPGFYHVEAIEKFNTDLGDSSKDTKFILLDGEVESKNVASVLYQTATSSFLAGYLSSLYLEASGDSNPTIGMWGGGNFPGVTDFMVGFVHGVKYYNNIREEGKSAVSFVQSPDNIDTWYTDSGFEVGGNGREKAEWILSNGGDVILPVAGPQMADAITEINVLNSSAKIVGVDTDAAQRFESKYFVTSIIKDIKKSVVEIYKVITNSVGSQKDKFLGLGKTSIGDLNNGLTNIVDNTNLAAWNGILNSKNIFEKASSQQLIEQANNLTAGKTWAETLILIKSLNNNDIK